MNKLGQEIKMEAPKLNGIYLRGGFHNLVCNCRVPHKNWKEQLQLDQYL